MTRQSIKRQTMLVISNEKMKTLDKAMRCPDRDEIRRELVDFFPALPPAELDSFIDTGFEKTARYGIDEHTATRDFIRLMIVVAKDFDNYPKAQEQLRRTGNDANLNVQLMCELLTPDEWQEAKNSGERATDRQKEDYVQKEIGDILSS